LAGADRRPLVADAGSTGPTGSFSEIHRVANGDPRGPSQNGLTAEFLGDHIYAAATNSYGAAGLERRS